MCAPGHMSQRAHMYVSVVVHAMAGLQWLPFGVCHIQDMETSRRAVDHIMDPWTHLVSELLGMMSWTTHPVDHIMDPWIHLEMSSCRW